LTDGAASFVAVDLHDGVDSRAFLTDISDGLLTWDTNGFAPFLYSDPVRPAPVADVAAIRAVPSALVGLLAVAMAGALGLGVTAAARARRRELAVMWALGCVTRQLRASVRWHALLVVGLGLAVGVPLGVALGGTSYRAFAAGLGFSPDPEVTVGWILLIVITSIVTGLLASAGATLVAGRSPAKVLLRNDC